MPDTPAVGAAAPAPAFASISVSVSASASASAPSVDASGQAAAIAPVGVSGNAGAAGADAVRYFPAIVCAEYDSPVDALVALTVPRDEALDLVVAAWPVWQRQRPEPLPPALADEFANKVCSEAAAQELPALLTQIDGGRHVAVLLTRSGRWAACNAFPEPPCLTLAAAEARLARLLRRGRHGCIGRLA